MFTECSFTPRIQNWTYIVLMGYVGSIIIPFLQTKRLRLREFKFSNVTQLVESEI